LKLHIALLGFQNLILFSR